MTLPPFDGPALKLMRAERHLRELYDVVSQYEHSARTEFYHNGDTENGWRIRLLDQPPREIPGIVGDIAHQLRSSLDVALCDIADIRNVGRNAIYFPFAENREKFEEKCQKSNRHECWKKLGDDIKNFIIAAQPYRGGNELLRALHDMNNQDKHKFVAPASYFVSVNHDWSIMMQNMTGNKFGVVMVGDQPTAFHEDTPLPDDCFRAHPSEAFTVNPRATRVLFAQGSICSGGAIFPTMEQMLRMVGKLIYDLRELATT